MILDNFGREIGAISTYKLLDEQGRPLVASLETIKPVPAAAEGDEPETEITRSFSYKLSIKDENGQKTYESADFFCSQKSRCPAAIRRDVSRDLEEFCMEEVQDGIRLFKERVAKKRAGSAKRSAA